MIEIKRGTDCIDWTQLIDLYEQTGLVGGLGTKKDLAGIKKAFLNSYRVVPAWDGLSKTTFFDPPLTTYFDPPG
jgi:hypothetical protein